MSLPTEAAKRKAVPIATGFIDYFPDAIAAVAELSCIGNDQHNPGKPLHWDRAKSTDEADCLMRHFVERGMIDTDGVRHSVKVAWRALALLQKEIENDQRIADEASRLLATDKELAAALTEDKGWIDWPESLNAASEECPIAEHWGYKLGQWVQVTNKSPLQGRKGVIIGFSDTAVLVEHHDAFGGDVRHWHPHFIQPAVSE